MCNKKQLNPYFATLHSHGGIGILLSLTWRFDHNIANMEVCFTSLELSISRKCSEPIYGVVPLCIHLDSGWGLMFSLINVCISSEVKRFTKECSSLLRWWSYCGLCWLQWLQLQECVHPAWSQQALVTGSLGCGRVGHLPQGQSSEECFPQWILWRG